MKKQLLKKLSAFIFTAILFSASANAQIVYTDVNPDTVISTPPAQTPKDYNLDLNNDGVNDFKISCSLRIGACQTARFYIFYVKDSALNANAVVADTNSTYTRPMNFNENIVSGLTFSASGYLRYERTTNQLCPGYIQGYWPLLSDRYLGLKLIVGANTYYGWARMQISFGNPTTCTIKDYAYNSIPNQPILAGQTIATGTNENSFASSINLFPNPATNQIIIDNGPDKIGMKIESVTIYDLTGNEVYIENHQNLISNREISIDVSKFPSGIYAVQVKTAGFIETKKLIIQK